jgi:biotin carboxylase
VTKTVLVLGGGLTQCDAIASARALGLGVVVADGNPQAPGMVGGDPDVVPLPVSFAAVDEVLAALAARRLAIDAVLPYGSDQSVLPAARLAERLGLASIGVDAARACTDKIEMRRRWAAAGVPTLPWAEVRDAADLARAAREIGLPVVVKPPDNAAQRGIRRVDDATDLPAAFEEARCNSPSGRVFVEEYVEGPEVAVTTFAAGGRTVTIQVTDRVTGPPPYLGICLAHVWPSRIGAADLAAVAELLPRAAEALGVAAGPTYSQVRLRGGVPWILETGARLGGGRDSELRLLVAGQDAIAAHLRLLLGEPVDLAADLDPAALRGGGCVRFLTAPAGVLTRVRGAEAALALDGVRTVAFFIHAGQRVPPLSSGDARVGYAIALGPDRAAAVARAEAAAAAICFDVEP